MTGRKALLLGAALVVTGSELVLWRALHDATESLQRMARIYADHRCSQLHTRRPDFAAFEMYEYTPWEPLVQPPPMADPAIARSPITLGRPK